MTPDKASFDVYYIKILGSACKENKEKTTILEKEYSVPMNIRLIYIEADNMLNLQSAVRQKYIESLNKPNTYIIYDLSKCKKGNGTRAHFYTEDFLLVGINGLCVSEFFVKEHMFFITSRKINQTIQIPFNDMANYFTEFAAHNNRIYKITDAYMQFHHAVLFADNGVTEDEGKQKMLLRAINGDGFAQYEYASEFEKNFMLYFLWMREALKNGCEKAKSMCFKGLERMDMDYPTIRRMYEELLEYGLSDAAHTLCDLETSRKYPNDANIKKYIQKGFELGGLMNYFRYASECCFVTGNFVSLHNHEEAIKGFQKLFEYYEVDNGFSLDYGYVSDRIYYMYYAYAIELDTGDDKAPQHELALEYYKKTLNVCDDFNHRLCLLARDYCEGVRVKCNIDHGIALLKLLNDKNLDEAQAYTIKLADRLMRERKFRLAEECYKMLIEHDRSFCDKYILAKTYRELNERKGTND